MATEKAEINRGRSISAIWVIPLLALVLGAYMVIHSMMTEGPEIEIALTTASGLEKGKTKIKYRNVDMGVVEEVRLNENFDGVIAIVKLRRQALPLLREDTRFWVVTARVGVGNISGLDTLLSGAYIQLAPGEGKEGARSFVALEHPPLTPTGAPGIRLHLTSDRASSISTGDTVLYKGYKVGRVESMEFDPDKRQVLYVIFIDAPYHQLINSAVRFWDASGISLSAGADGFKVETGSVDTVLLGGVAFGVPEGIKEGEPVEHNSKFKLYESYESILENPFEHGTYYVVSFDQSIKGLLPGAPVEYRGIAMGRVERLLLKEFMLTSTRKGLEGKGDPIPVLIYLEPARLELSDSKAAVETLHKAVATGVGNGLRASLESGNLLTGAKYIAMDYYSDAEDASVGTSLGYPTIPTIGTGLDQLQQKITSILDMINGLPLDQTVDNANAAISSLNQSLQSLDKILENQSTQELPAELNRTLQELRITLDGLSPGSEIHQSINSSLLRLNRTLGNIETISGTLAEQPNAIVLPSSSKPDPVPEANND